MRFGKTPQYERLASVINRGVARPLVERFPVGLLLGCWASRKHNPQGATRIARAVTSEIIGYDVLDGQRAASKVDLQHISRDVKLVEETNGGARFRVVDEKERGAKRPSEFGYGNVTPSAASHGGVTVRFAEQQTVISVAALRAVRMGELGQDGATDPATDLVARRLLALLAIAMLEAQVELGWDLRSGCQLVPETEPTLELVGRLGQTVRETPLAGLGAIEALRAEVGEATGAGIDWTVEPVKLRASPPQLELLRRSLGRPPEEFAEG